MGSYIPHTAHLTPASQKARRRQLGRARGATTGKLTHTWRVLTREPHRKAFSPYPTIGITLVEAKAKIAETQTAAAVEREESARRGRYPHTHALDIFEREVTKSKERLIVLINIDHQTER